MPRRHSVPEGVARSAKRSRLGIGAFSGWREYCFPIMGKQLKSRLSSDGVALVLAKFTHGDMTVPEACVALGVGRSRLYELKTQWLRQRGDFKLGGSGGDTTGGWSREAHAIAGQLVEQSLGADGEAVNYALIADAIACETGHRLSRTAVMRYCRKNWPLLCAAQKRARPVKRWAMESTGALWQIDSTPIHLFGPEGEMQHLVVIEDDATREIVAIGIFEADSVFAEMAVFREAVLARGLPQAIYTDGFTVFGHEGEDIATAYGRMCGALSVTHQVAPTPQAKGKIERSMRTFQHRVRALVLAAMASSQVTSLTEAVAVARRHIAYWNANHVNATTKLTPTQLYRKCVASGKSLYRAAPSPTLLDLFMARHEKRRVSGGNRIAYRGREYVIASTTRKHVWLVIHPDRFYVVDRDPLENRTQWPRKLAEYRQ